MNADDRAHWLQPSPPLPVDDDEPREQPPEASPHPLPRAESPPAPVPPAGSLADRY